MRCMAARFRGFGALDAMLVADSLHQSIEAFKLCTESTQSRCMYMAACREFGALDATLEVDSLPPSNILGTISDTPCDHTSH